MPNKPQEDFCEECGKADTEIGELCERCSRCWICCDDAFDEDNEPVNGDIYQHFGVSRFDFL